MCLTVDNSPCAAETCWIFQLLFPQSNDFYTQLKHTSSLYSCLWVPLAFNFPFDCPFLDAVPSLSLLALLPPFFSHLALGTVCREKPVRSPSWRKMKATFYSKDLQKFWQNRTISFWLHGSSTQLSNLISVQLHCTTALLLPRLPSVQVRWGCSLRSPVPIALFI